MDGGYVYVRGSAVDGGYVCVRVCACMRTRVRVRVRVWAVCGWRSKNGNQTAKISTKTLGGVRQRDAKGTTLSFSTQWQRTTEAEWWQTSQKVAYERRRQRGPELIGRHPHVGKLHETTTTTTTTTTKQQTGIGRNIRLQAPSITNQHAVAMTAKKSTVHWRRWAGVGLTERFITAYFFPS